MRRREYLGSMLAGAALMQVPGRAATGSPIRLDVDLSVDPAREAEMLKNFHNVFKPAAMKHTGYLDVNILKLRSALMGKAPEGMNYRFTLTFQSEELRQQWVASDVHQRVWPTIENTLTSKDYRVLLFDVK